MSDQFLQKIKSLLHTKYWYMLPLLVLISLLVRMPGLNFHSLWFDEVSTAFMISQPDYIELIKSLYTFEGTPPLFYIITKLFIDIFHLPVNEISLRILPLLCGAGVTILVFLIVDEIANRISALYSFFLTVFSSFHIYMSLEARTYGLLTLFTLFSLLLIIKIINKPSRFKTILFFIIVFLTVQLHYYAIFWIVSLVLSMLIVMRNNNTIKRTAIQATIVAVFSFALLIPMILGQMSHEVGSIREELVSKWHLGVLFSPVKILIGSFLFKIACFADISTIEFSGIIPALFLITFAFVLLTYQFVSGRLNAPVKIISISIILTFIIYCICGWKVPTIHPRYMINFLILLFPLIVLSVQNYKKIQFMIVFCLLFINIIGLYNFYNRSFPYFEPWKDVAKFSSNYFEKQRFENKTIIADFSICNTIAFYSRNSDISFFTFEPSSQPVQCAKLDLFGNTLHTRLFTTKFYPEDTVVSVNEIFRSNKAGLLISKDNSSHQRMNELIMNYGQNAKFSLLKSIPTNQGYISIFEWNAQNYAFNNLHEDNYKSIFSSPDTLTLNRFYK